MTRASISRRLRRQQRGRPKNERIDPLEQFEIMLATALEFSWGLSKRKSFDLVVAMIEAEREVGGGFRLPYATFAGRTDTLKKKRREHGVPSDEVVGLMTLALRCKDLPAALRLFRSLLLMAQVRGVKAMEEYVKHLLAH